MSADSGSRMDPRRGADLYSPFILSLYDVGVHGVSNTFAWKCPTSDLVALHDANVSARHMDIGVGTGFFLDRCRFPAPDPAIALVDLNENTLRFASDRIRRYRPKTYVANVLEPFTAGGEVFGSIGMTYLLHCLPGDLRSKAVVFRNIRPMLAEGGVVFGATILGRGVPRNALAEGLLRAYNKRGIFSNREDSEEGLREALEGHFDRVSITVRGMVAIFTARGAQRDR
ncbi:MAG TPA: class I SAM-dependent methyltransferase [Polyangiaceae bacterium]|nr:class I SAM-dependent methyltransferase [Polyangiaceae bacterium]